MIKNRVTTQVVIPAKAGIQFVNRPFKNRLTAWIPAFVPFDDLIIMMGQSLWDAGMTWEPGQLLFINESPLGE